MQQIGFALPAVFGIIASLTFGLGNDEVSDFNIMMFYFSIAVFVVPGHITWVSDLKRYVLQHFDVLF